MTIRKKLVILFGIIFLMVLGGVVTVAGLLMIAPAENNSNSENIVSSTVSTSNQNNSENVKAVSEKYILINRSAVSSYYFNYLYDSFRFTKYANPDKEFMIVSLEIENYGYDEFKVNPYNYKVVVDNVSYTPSYFNYNIPDLLKSVTLKNGGKTYGILVYELPENSRWYHIEYTGSVGYKLKYGDLILEKEIVEDDEEVILSLTNDIDTGFEESDFSHYYEGSLLNESTLYLYFERTNYLDEEDILKEVRNILIETRSLIIDSSYDKPEYVYLKYNYDYNHQGSTKYSINLTWDEVYGIKIMQSSKFNEKLIIE